MCIEELLGERPVVFEPIPECASADDVIALGPQPILQLAEPNRLEDDQPFVASLPNRGSSSRSLRCNKLWSTGEAIRSWVMG